MKNKEYTYFWNGYLSNWHSSSFIVEGEKFSNSEQYMMWAKSKLMGDEEIAEKILNTSNPRECKALGRKVKNFNVKLWDLHKENIVFEGCLQKFSQNSNLKEQLLKTKGKLVEASPYDKIWGIGLDEEHAKKVNPENWPGQNLLGEVLTKVREEIKSKNI